MGYNQTEGQSTPYDNMTASGVADLGPNPHVGPVNPGDVVNSQKFEATHPLMAKVTQVGMDLGHWLVGPMQPGDLGNDLQRLVGWLFDR